MGLQGVQDLLGHAAVSGPLATGHRDQPWGFTADQVFAGHLAGRLSGVTLPCAPHQGAQSHPHTAHITGLQGQAKRGVCFAKQKVQLFGHGLRLAWRIGAWGVGGANQGGPQPRYGKQHPAISGAGNQHRFAQRQTRSSDHQVHALTGRDQSLERRPSGHGRQGHPAKFIHPHPRRVDHAARLHRAQCAPSRIEHAHLPTVLYWNQRSHVGVVVHASACPPRGLGQGPRQTGIFKLAIPITHARHRTPDLSPHTR